MAATALIYSLRNKRYFFKMKLLVKLVQHHTFTLVQHHTFRSAGVLCFARNREILVCYEIIKSDTQEVLSNITITIRVE